MICIRKALREGKESDVRRVLTGCKGVCKGVLVVKFLSIEDYLTFFLHGNIWRLVRDEIVHPAMWLGLGVWWLME